MSQVQSCSITVVEIRLLVHIVRIEVNRSVTIYIEPIDKFLPLSSIEGTEKGYSSKALNISGISEDMSK